MNDLISRQAAIDFIDAGRLCNPNEPRWSDNEIVNFLKSRPSADIDLSDYSDRLWRKAYEQGKADAEADIVRCRDCEWYDITHPYGTVIPDAYHCKANDRFYSAEHFCAYGERKDDAEV